MNLIEKISRKNIYIYIFSKYVYQTYLYRIFFEEEFRILKYIKNKKKIILDVGSNSGVSAKSIRLFNKKNKIVSLEPNKNLNSKLFDTKKKMPLFSYFLFGALNKKKKIPLFIPFFKKYSLDAQSSIKLDYVLDSLKRGIFEKNILKKISVKKIICEFKPIDEIKLNPFFVKIDTEGSEHLVLMGMSKTIKKAKPTLMIEKNDINYFLVKKFLIKNNYSIYSFKNEKLKIYKFKKKEHLNMICIHNSQKKILKAFF
tara:strand:+ start:440 stop:1207 length:768 start_codon:yes stop_codon:yes gene_type:complete